MLLTMIKDIKWIQSRLKLISEKGFNVLKEIGI